MRFLTLVAVALLAGTAHADPAVATYAIVVGSNAGGPGQADLRYAEDDARRVAAVLTDLGGYAPDTVDVVVHPTPDQLRDRLAKLADRVQADVAAGRQARVFFYYSGHARAQAIDLGSTELPLAELRERLFKVPAALTVVVLDACQSGAFSRIKGAAPAADFSYSSRQHLDATGVAVLASSSGSELSQESEQLKSSYFTHHLLVGLRGAGDANNDGQVSIDEAYRYAYHQTLLATAETAVGGQHVTFEADLKGHGEVPLSYPRAATAAIVLPARLEGKTLVEDRRAHAVVAETYKAKGAAVRIAVAPGDYDVLVRDGDSLSRCPISAPGEIDLAQCHREALVTDAAKGGGWEDPHRYMVMLDLLAGPEHEDAYTQNLAAFGYHEDARTVGRVRAHAGCARSTITCGSAAPAVSRRFRRGSTTSSAPGSVPTARLERRNCDGDRARRGLLVQLALGLQHGVGWPRYRPLGTRRRGWHDVFVDERRSRIRGRARLARSLPAPRHRRRLGIRRGLGREGPDRQHARRRW